MRRRGRERPRTPTYAARSEHIRVETRSRRSRGNIRKSKRKPALIRSTRDPDHRPDHGEIMGDRPRERPGAELARRRGRCVTAHCRLSDSRSLSSASMAWPVAHRTAGAVSAKAKARRTRRSRAAMASIPRKTQVPRAISAAIPRRATKPSKRARTWVATIGRRSSRTTCGRSSTTRSARTARLITRWSCSTAATCARTCPRPGARYASGCSTSALRSRWHAALSELRPTRTASERGADHGRSARVA